MIFWKPKPRPAPPPVEIPPRYRPKSGAVVLYPGQVMLLSPALRKLMEGTVNAHGTALMLDTLYNSAIIPPEPWPQALHRFDSMVMIPTTDGEGKAALTPVFVFYPA